MSSEKKIVHNTELII